MSVVTLLPAMLGNYAVQTPLFLVWIAGIAWCVIRWKDHPQVSLLVLIALVIFVMQALLGGFLNIWLPYYFIASDQNPDRMAYIFMARGVVQSIVAAGAWGLLLIAMFRWRQQSTN